MFGGGKNVIIVLMMMMAHRCSDATPLPTPNGVNYIGIGYNILEGNPEGGNLASGGVDPGLLVSRRIFDLSYDEAKTSSDGQYQVPDEVNFIHRSSAYTSSSRTTFYGTSSYASKLAAQVDVSGSYSSLFSSVSFAASTRYQNIKTRTSSRGTVFFATETISNLGNARYLTELARTNRFKLNNGFVAHACNLPSTYVESDYMNFLDDWGTHVVTEVNLGTREGTNYEEARSSFVSYASTQVGSSVRASGTYGAYSASLSVDMDSFNSAMESGTSFGSTYSSYTVGSASLNEPISLTLIGMHEVFNLEYWMLRSLYVRTGHCRTTFRPILTGKNILRAMRGYAEWKRIEGSTNPEIRIPLTWPDGTYTLPKPISGCPNSKFKWSEGFRQHDTEDSNSNNYWSSTWHLAGWKARDNIKYHFCTKTTPVVDTHTHWTWQPGSYCIYKHGNCPADFTHGYLNWDDEDSSNNNQAGGTKPDGNYGRDTRIEFCCRRDGVSNRDIYLPTDDNFILFPRFEHCQQVNGMIVTHEWFRFDNEDSSNKDHQGSAHPYEGLQGGGDNIVLHYCYYQRP